MGVERRVAASDWTEPDTQPLNRPLSPERVVLGVREGVSPSPLPPVRIFLGTETGQYRAERVFVWSINQVRDPSRVYEITLMKDLPGFNRGKWLTGFTNYRFAIPELAGRIGRAIYNDVDQIYLRDPAELFDTPMGEHGFLSISDRDTSVMLIDCARMARVWPIEVVRRQRRKGLEARARAVAALWGPLDAGWNARDEEYQAGRSGLIHYTVLQTQPWQPFPQRFVYQPNPVGDVWESLEQSADAAGYQLFSAADPSAKLRALAGAYRSGAGSTDLGSGAATEAGACTRVPPSTAWDGLPALLTSAEAGSVLHYTLGATGAPAAIPADRDPDVKWARRNPLARGGEAIRPEAHDGVVCSELLEYLPDEDLPWLVDEMFAAVCRFVFVIVDDHDAGADAHPGLPLTRRRRERSWWLTLFERASVRRPRVHWRLVRRDRDLLGRAVWVRNGGGRPTADPPRVWVLEDDKTGHSIQSEGLARALGWPYQVKRLRFNGWNRLSNWLLDARLTSLDRGASDTLEPPWPDLVIGTGRRLAPLARWIAQQSRGATRLVQMGRKGGEVAEHFDLVVGCTHFRQPWHPHRIDILVPLNVLGPATLQQAAERWQGLFADARRPHIALVVGGSSALHVLEPATARRMGEKVRDLAESLGGSVFAITSPRTGERAAEALTEGLGEGASVHLWRRGEAENPYFGYLALADILVVTGESESMLSEAAATDKPLLIYPLPERAPGVRARLAEAIVRCSQRPRYNKRGTVRPQRGLQYLCARMVDRGLAHPRRDLAKMHALLVERGVAQMFGDRIEQAVRPVLRETERVAQRVRRLMGHEA